MSKLKALQSDEYKHMYWQKPQSLFFAAQDNISALSASEVTEAAASLPIVFIRQGEGFVLAALQSFQPDKNLLVNEKGIWIGMYRPMRYFYYPFCLAGHEGKQVVCERTGSGLISQAEDGMALFDESGEKTPEFEDLLAQLNRHQAGLDRAAELTKEIAGLDLLVEWPIQFPNKDKTIALSGVYRIDEEKLNSLPASKFVELRDTGILHICYSQLVSMYNIRLLNYLHQTSNKATNNLTDVLDFDSGGSLNFENL